MLRVDTPKRKLTFSRNMPNADLCVLLSHVPDLRVATVLKQAKMCWFTLRFSLETVGAGNLVSTALTLRNEYKLDTSGRPCMIGVGVWRQRLQTFERISFPILLGNVHSIITSFNLIDK